MRAAETGREFAPLSKLEIIERRTDCAPRPASIMTGTSQAAPHVSGVVAQYFERVPHATVDMVMNYLLKTAAYGVIQNTKVNFAAWEPMHDEPVATRDDGVGRCARGELLPRLGHACLEINVVEKLRHALL